MAKQTFTTGQVLTAAQMTSLQQTAMGGGSTTAKTASYVLVAADAGTVVQMNAAGATTITVNTALFAAGDTVFIQNIGAGVCTVTAGTATVNTAGSLALSQYEGGQLYFNATGAAVFFDLVQSAAAGGKLLQVVQGTYSGQIESTTTTYADTGLTVTTAALATTGSRVKIDLNCFVSKRASNAASGVKLQLLRGATVITEITPSATYTGTTIDNWENVGFSYVDSPATTSATTYKVQYANVTAASGVFFSVSNGPCYIIAQEIGA
jgi:hypothetical protein